MKHLREKNTQGFKDRQSEGERERERVCVCVCVFVRKEGLLLRLTNESSLKQARSAVSLQRNRPTLMKGKLSI